jgi:hypothetical protein
MIEMTIDLDDKLYEQAMKRPHQNHRLNWKEFYVNHESHEYINKKNSRQRQKQNFYKHTSMKLNIVKKKQSKINDKRQDKEKKIKSCYICDKKDHFAKNFKSKNNMIRRQQINATLRKQSRAKSKKNWKKIDYESSISTFNSKNEDFYRIKKSEDFQKVLKKRIKKTFASTKKINTIIQRFVSQRFKTFYSQKNLFEKIKNEKNKNSNFEKMLRRFENILNNENENSKNKITNHFEKKLKSNVTIKRQIKHAKIIKKKISHNDLNWTECYNDDCMIHMLTKNNVEWYFKKSKKQEKRSNDKSKKIMTYW